MTQVCGNSTVTTRLLDYDKMAQYCIVEYITDHGPFRAMRFPIGAIVLDDKQELGCQVVTDLEDHGLPELVTTHIMAFRNRVETALNDSLHTIMGLMAFAKSFVHVVRLTTPRPMEYAYQPRIFKHPVSYQCHFAAQKEAELLFESIYDKDDFIAYMKLGKIYEWEPLSPREPKKIRERNMHPSVKAIMRHFRYEHLPENLQQISKPIGELAKKMAEELPDDPEKTAGLRKLLEAKDCLVRAALPPEA